MEIHKINFNKSLCPQGFNNLDKTTEINKIAFDVLTHIENSSKITKSSTTKVASIQNINMPKEPVSVYLAALGFGYIDEKIKKSPSLTNHLLLEREKINIKNVTQQPSLSTSDYAKSFSCTSKLNSSEQIQSELNDKRFLFKESSLNLNQNLNIIRKKQDQQAKQIRNISLKFLKPPPPPPAGDITITQESDVQAPAAPPLHVTQKSPHVINPIPLLISDNSPELPAPIGPRNIVIPGKVIPPPPRKVIVERLPQLPPKPQDIIVERWLGYQRRVRNVRFIPAPPIIPAPAPKNVLIQWDSPDVEVRQAFHFLGVQVTCPVQYAATHGASLRDASQLPAEVARFQTPAGEVLACNSNSNLIPQLVGAVQSLRLINLACNGLSEYSSQC